MKNHTNIIHWATDWLVSQKYSLQNKPETVQKTPWSKVIRFPTSQGSVYLKQPAPLLAQEARVIQLLDQQFHAHVPMIIATNDKLHCFLMKDAGPSLRQHLKTQFQPDLLCRAIQEFSAFQRSTENHIAPFLALNIPDWRLNQLPKLYETMIHDDTFLKMDGLTNKELEALYDLGPKISEEFEQLSEFNIPETIVQPDFNTNNVLFNPDTHQLTFIDLGELTITHPFFSLHNFLYTATVHHGVKEHDRTWRQLENACFESWLDRSSESTLLKAFELCKKLWPIYSACVNYRFMHCVDLQALNAWYANKPNRLAGALREYMAST